MFFEIKHIDPITPTEASNMGFKNAVIEVEDDRGAYYIAVFYIKREQLNEFAVYMASQNYFVQCKEWEPVHIMYRIPNECSMSPRIHPDTIQAYITYAVKSHPVVNVFVNGKLYLKKHVEPVMNWVEDAVDDGKQEEDI